MQLLLVCGTYYLAVASHSVERNEEVSAYRVALAVVECDDVGVVVMLQILAVHLKNLLVVAEYVGNVAYLLAILVAIGVFRASGGMDVIMGGIAWCAESVGLGSDFVGALPTAIMKPLSGSGARGMMVDAMNTYGADSFTGRLACLFQGATDTTFYILAVYFGSVGIRKTRHAVTCGLLADLAGIIAAIIVGYIFFG